MKVILTEQQINEMITIEEAKNLLKSLINKYINKDTFDVSQEEYENIKLRIKISCKLLGLTVVSLILINAPRIIKSAYTDVTGEQIEHVVNQKSQEEQRIYDERVNQLQNYMNEVAVLNGFNPSQLKVSAKDFIDICDKYNFNVLLCAAQAHQESCFGLSGKRCRQTNSIFSVGLYDNGNNLVHFNTQRESIEHYVMTMQKDYLINGKEVSHLLKNGNFVNNNGHRYASDKTYEKKIRILMNKISKNCPNL